MLIVGLARLWNLPVSLTHVRLLYLSIRTGDLSPLDSTRVVTRNFGHSFLLTHWTYSSWKTRQLFAVTAAMSGCIQSTRISTYITNSCQESSRRSQTSSWSISHLSACPGSTYLHADNAGKRPARRQNLARKYERRPTLFSGRPLLCSAVDERLKDVWTTWWW